jgi:hypothetical protein
VRGLGGACPSSRAGGERQASARSATAGTQGQAPLGSGHWGAPCDAVLRQGVEVPLNSWRARRCPVISRLEQYFHPHSGRWVERRWWSQSLQPRQALVRFAAAFNAMLSSCCFGKTIYINIWVGSGSSISWLRRGSRHGRVQLACALPCVFATIPYGRHLEGLYIVLSDWWLLSIWGAAGLVGDGLGRATCGLAQGHGTSLWCALHTYAFIVPFLHATHVHHQPNSKLGSAGARWALTVSLVVREPQPCIAGGRIVWWEGGLPRDAQGAAPANAFFQCYPPGNIPLQQPGTPVSPVTQCQPRHRHSPRPRWQQARHRRRMLPTITSLPALLPVTLNW